MVGWQSETNPIKIRLMREVISQKSLRSALDLGCGMGFYSRFLLESGLKVKAMDYVDRELPEGIEFERRNLEENVDLGENCFDLVLAWDVLEHVQNDADLLKAIFRSLRPEGILLVSVPHSDDSRIQKSYLTYCHFKDETHLREYTVQSLKEDSKKAGFLAERVFLEGGDAYPFLPLHLVDNPLARFVLKIVLKLYLISGLIRLDSAHGDVYGVFQRRSP